MPSIFPALSGSSTYLAPYPSTEALMAAVRQAVASAGGTETVAGTSVEGRPVVRFDMGTMGRPVVFLTSLMHGIEVIGALALLDVLERLANPADAETKRLLSEAHLVVLPIVNPDAFFSNMTKIAQGDRAWQRCNAEGVDLNRNFPRLTTNRLYHPFSGSRFKLSPHYLGPHALSEPESRAVYKAARETRPMLSLAFHSFGNLLLYPWAYTELENARTAEYRALGSAMTEGLLHVPYRVQQARQLYSVLGDLDDWLDAEFDTLAFTIEVSRPDVRLRDGRHLWNPFRWMNPLRIRETVDNLTPGVLALLTAALGLSQKPARRQQRKTLIAPPLEFAAK
jgi:hypothetical protein